MSAPRPVTPLGLLVERLQRITQRVDGTDAVDAELRADLHDACALAAGLDPYVEQWTTPESSALARLAAATAAHDWNASQEGVPGGALEQEMLSGHVEGQTLKMLVHATRAIRVLEIGMFTGYSALAMAEALPDGGQVIACEIDAGVAAFAQRCFADSPVGDRITVEVGPALDTVHALSARGVTFDLVFIDADKGGYVDYLNAVLDRALLTPHGLICVDNTLMQGQPWATDDPPPNGAAIAAFNRAVADDPRVEQVILPLRDGLTLIRRVDTAA